MKHGSLFSGIGGFDLASEWMGWENVFHCELMEFPRKVLEYHFPNADSLIDICKTDFKKYEGTIDIISGGFPCQPFSLAGKRKGTDDERYLWGEMLRAIQEIKPKFVIAENVFGITNIDGGLVFEQVCLDLENEGYEVQPFIIPAAAKNAPHRRDRCWFIGVRNATDTHGNGFQQRNGNDEINASEGRINAFGNVSESHGNGDVANPNFGEPKQPTFNCRMGRFGKQHEKDSWKFFPTQSPICGGDDGLPTELDGITFSKWRAESIKGYGNAIVPQVALELFKVIEKINCNLSK
jgi:DNA (cytosine-5)-methyltransferase 1